MSADNQLMLLVASLVVEIIMAVALGTVSLLAKRSLAAIDSIQVALGNLNLVVVGKYYSREDHDAYAQAMEARMAEFREYVRNGIHDATDDLQEHEVNIRLLAQHVKFDMPSKRPRSRGRS